MRDAGDAISIRAYVQQTAAARPSSPAAGSSGLEAAYSLYELGLQVTVLERGPRLLVPPDRPAMQRTGPQILRGDSACRCCTAPKP